MARVAKKRRQAEKIERMSFQQCVANAAHQNVSGAFRPGLRAMGTYSQKVLCSDTSKLRGSIDLDSALATDPAFAQSNRWDYGFGFGSNNQSEIAVWVEVHSAYTSEVSCVIKKKNWLRDYLISNCPDLWRITNVNGRVTAQFHWVASNGVKISKNSPQARALATAGIPWPQNVLKLD